jgi:hypothetical protein
MIVYYGAERGGVKVPNVDVLAYDLRTSEWHRLQNTGEGPARQLCLSVRHDTKSLNCITFSSRIVFKATAVSGRELIFVGSCGYEMVMDVYKLNLTTRQWTNCVAANTKKPIYR